MSPTASSPESAASPVVATHMPLRAAPRICVTPMRNEAWIADRFAAAATCWADRVIVADQLSTDGTPALLERVPGVSVVQNDSPVFDESHRQRLLLSKAREVPGRRILIGLDADEALSANCIGSRDWDRIANAAPGTVLRFRWVNILPGFTRAWIPPGFVPLGFVDDGSPHEGGKIHSPRVPQPAGAPTLDLEDIVVLHFQYVLWDRMASKQRWYQAWEYDQHRQKGPLEIFRQYNHMHGSWGSDEIFPVRPEWFANYEEKGIDFRSLKSEPVTWWDREVALMLSTRGPGHFRRVAVWDMDWNAVARRAGLRTGDLSDPRSPFEKLSHRILSATQNRRGNLAVRAFEHLLRRIGW